MPSREYIEKKKAEIGAAEWYRREAKRKLDYYKQHPDKCKASNKKWNAKNRNEYQRKYRAKQKTNSK